MADVDDNQHFNEFKAVNLIQQVDVTPDELNTQANHEPLNPLENQIGQSEDDIYISTGLHAYLKKNSVGKEILKAYKQCLDNNIPLKRTIRSKLVRLVISREKDWVLRGINEDEVLEKFVISKERFEILANEIAHLFQGEHAATYFTAFVQQDKKCILANGKLWHHYNYTKHCLRNANLLLHKNLSKNKLPNILTLDELESINDNAHISWLSNHLEPWEEVTLRWKTSFDLRKQMLIQTNISVYDYIEKFACLRTQKAIELYSIDFELIFPGKNFIETDQWKKIKSILMTYLDTNIKIKNIEDAILLGVLKSNALTSAKEDFLILYLLCYIITPKRSRKRKQADPDREARKLSLQERRESFLLRVETAEDVRPKLLDLKERYMRDHETFQPVIIGVGESTRIENFYVAVNEQLLAVDTVLAAVELALKIFFTLDCKYPENTKTIWVFLQKVLFKIDSPFDVLTIESNIIIGHIQNLLK